MVKEICMSKKIAIFLITLIIIIGISATAYAQLRIEFNGGIGIPVVVSGGYTYTHTDVNGLIAGPGDEQAGIEIPGFNLGTTFNMNILYSFPFGNIGLKGGVNMDSKIPLVDSFGEPIENKTYEVFSNYNIYLKYLFDLPLGDDEMFNLGFYGGAGFNILKISADTTSVYNILKDANPNFDFTNMPVEFQSHLTDRIFMGFGAEAGAQFSFMLAENFYLGLDVAFKFSYNTVSLYHNDGMGTSIGEDDERHNLSVNFMNISAPIIRLFMWFRMED